MRCDDLTRELASPAGARPSSQMLEHLAACPSCARFSQSAAHLDRIWDATRPAEPSMDALEALWARASAELDRIPAPATLKMTRPTRSRARRWGMVGLITAQAAAVLVGALILMNRGGNGNKAIPKDLAANLTPAIEPREPEFINKTR